MAPFVDGGPSKPFAYLCLVKFTGVQVDGTEIEEQFIKMTAAWSSEAAEANVLEALGGEPRGGFRSQENEVVYTQDVHPRELAKLLEQTEDSDDAGLMGCGKYSHAQPPTDALVV